MSILESEPPYELLTQTWSSRTASEDGPSATSIRLTFTRIWDTRLTDWPNSLATHTSVAVTAKAAGPESTRMSAASASRSARRAGSACWPGRSPPTTSIRTGRVRPGRRRRGSAGPPCSVAGFTCWTVLSHCWRPRRRPGRPTTAAGAMPTWIVHDDPRRDVDPGQDLLVVSGHPEVVAAGRHGLGRPADATDGVDDGARVRVDLHHGVSALQRRPRQLGGPDQRRTVRRPA